MYSALKSIIHIPFSVTRKKENKEVLTVIIMIMSQHIE